MVGPVGEHGRDPGADPVRRRRQQQRLHHRGALEANDRQRQQDADQQRDGREFPVVLVHHRAGPRKFRLAVGVQNAPIGPDAALEEFPGLVDRFDDVVFHADRFGADHEIAQHHRLLERPGIGIAQIIAGARPAELRDHDPLAGKLVAQHLVDIDGLVDGLLGGEVFPIGQHVRGDEVDRGSELRIVAPDVPDFARRNRHVDGFLHLLDQFDQVVDLLFAAIDGLVADDDADDVAVVPGKIDGGFDFARVAIGILVDPGADHDLEAEFGRDRRHQFDAAGRRIEPDRPRQRRQLLHVGADFVGVGDVVDVGMRRFPRTARRRRSAGCP